MTLNRSQARAVEVALRLLEERLSTIQGILDRGDRGVLYDRPRLSLAAERRAHVDGLLAEVNAAIASISDSLQLERNQRDPAREVLGLLNVSWEGLAEIGSRRLRAYGRVDSSLLETLDPALDRIMQLLSTLEEAVGDAARADARLASGPTEPSKSHPRRRRERQGGDRARGGLA